jgi:hypothetical protein
MSETAEKPKTGLGLFKESFKKDKHLGKSKFNVSSNKKVFFNQKIDYHLKKVKPSFFLFVLKLKQ